MAFDAQQTRRYQYIEIRHHGDSPSGKTHIWKVYNRSGGYVLGWIAYRPGWRQYVFEPDDATEYSAGCLDDISAFMGEAK
jgi:hypothetical protein